MFVDPPTVQLRGPRGELARLDTLSFGPIRIDGAPRHVAHAGHTPKRCPTGARSSPRRVHVMLPLVTRALIARPENHERPGLTGPERSGSEVKAGAKAALEMAGSEVGRDSSRSRRRHDQAQSLCHPCRQVRARRNPLSLRRRVASPGADGEIGPQDRAAKRMRRRSPVQGASAAAHRPQGSAPVRTVSSSRSSIAKRSSPPVPGADVTAVPRARARIRVLTPPPARPNLSAVRRTESRRARVRSGASSDPASSTGRSTSPENLTRNPAPLVGTPTPHKSPTRKLCGRTPRTTVHPNPTSITGPADPIRPASTARPRGCTPSARCPATHAATGKGDPNGISATQATPATPASPTTQTMELTQLKGKTMSELLRFCAGTRTCRARAACGSRS